MNTRNGWLNFHELKRTVSIEAVLNMYGVRLSRAGPNYLRGCCPLPSHNSSRGTASFGVDLAKNAWACQSASCIAARNGRRGGSVLDLVAALECSSLREAALSIQAGGLGSELAARKPVTPAAAAEENRPLSFTLRPLDPGHSYLRSRGITKETAERFGVGFFPGPGLMKNRVVLPVHDHLGRLVAYLGRSVKNEQPKYLVPPQFKKSLVLFNFFRAAQASRGGPVIVVEGAFSCLRLAQAGFPSSIALLGTTLSESQEELLRGNFGRISLMLDPDDAGQTASRSISSRLHRRGIDVEFVELPEGIQPDQLPPERLRGLLGDVRHVAC